MSILVFEHRTPRSIQNFYNYLTDPLKTSCEYIFGIGCNPLNAAKEMSLVKDNIFYKDDLIHSYLQVIFVFDEGLSLPLDYVKNICIDIGYALIIDQRQLFGAIHYKDKDQFKTHCHYMINSVSIEGKLYHQVYSLQHYKKAINNILTSHGLNPIRMYKSCYKNFEWDYNALIPLDLI